jgi:hypothetical protein
MVGPLEVKGYGGRVHQRFVREEIVMAKVIDFYVPTNFRTPLKGKSRRRRYGKIIEFCTQTKKSA